MKVLFLIGNGFNYMIEDIIRHKVLTSNPTPEQLKEGTEVADSIRAITALWQKFQETFAAFHEQFSEKGIKISDEDLIRMINSVITLFSNISGFEQILPREDIEKLKLIFDNFMLDKIREISEEFRKHQQSEAYGKIRNNFSNFSRNVEDFVNANGVEKCNIFTTNYDGIIDTLLTRWPNGFMFADGFIDSDTDGLLKLVPNFIKRDKLMIGHLHGSYRFAKYYGKTYKTKENIINQEPVMVFNNPNMKEEIIKGDTVLRDYFELFADCLSSYDKLIILGNSMEAEPHLKKLIKAFFNRTGTSITVCSRSPANIKAEIKPFYKGNIIEETTRGINTEDAMIALFGRFLSPV